MVGEEKQNITYSQRVFVDLGIQNALQMRYIVTLAFPAVHYLSTLSHTRHNFRKKVTKMCV
jgi:hypothetical protein